MKKRKKEERERSSKFRIGDQAYCTLTNRFLWVVESRNEAYVLRAANNERAYLPHRCPHLHRLARDWKLTFHLGYQEDPLSSTQYKTVTILVDDATYVKWQRMQLTAFAIAKLYLRLQADFVHMEEQYLRSTSKIRLQMQDNPEKFAIQRDRRIGSY